MKSLGVKYRPQVWDEIIGQEDILIILKRQIQTHTFKNAYIFSGASGSGKTTCARIFANEINRHLGSPIEIDAASNNSVDNIHQILDNTNEQVLDSEYKIYIIDEAHTLSNQVWQTFLKAIEETPKYTIFIFCTTAIQKIPDAIKNRCMRFSFARIPAYQIKPRLEYICQKEGYINYTETCDYISRICKGEMHTALSMLEICANYSNNFSIDNTIKVLGNFSYDIYFTLINAIIDGDFEKSFKLIAQIYNDENDLMNFVNSFLVFILDILKYIICKDIRVTKFPSSLEEPLNFATNISNASTYYMYIADKLLELKNMLKNDTDIKSTIEVMIIQMCRLK